MSLTMRHAILAVLPIVGAGAVKESIGFRRRLATPLLETETCLDAYAQIRVLQAPPVRLASSDGSDERGTGHDGNGTFANKVAPD